jgi:hypothetical protein
MSWRLEGGQDLDKHVGHEVQVTGHTDWSGSSSSSMPTTSTASPTTTAAAAATTTSGAQDAMTAPRLDVSAVKMISSSCQ